MKFKKVLEDGTTAYIDLVEMQYNVAERYGFVPVVEDEEEQEEKKKPGRPASIK